MSDNDKLTIDQKIAIARIASDIYMVEYQNGHSSLLPRRQRDNIDLLPESEQKAAIAALKQQQIQQDYLATYQAVINAINAKTDAPE